MKTDLEKQVTCLSASGRFKASYTSRQKAKAHAREDLRKYGKKLRPYYCEVCNHFHLRSIS